MDERLRRDLETARRAMERLMSEGGAPEPWVIVVPVVEQIRAGDLVGLCLTREGAAGRPCQDGDRPAGFALRAFSPGDTLVLPGDLVTTLATQVEGPLEFPARSE